VKVDEHFAGHLLEAEIEEIESGGIGVEDFADRAAGDDADVKVFDEGAEAFFAFAKGINGAVLIGDVADDDESAAAAVEIEKSARQLPGAKQAGFGLKGEVDVANFLTFAEMKEDFRAARGFRPKI
jgi:hypothetical protein